MRSEAGLGFCVFVLFGGFRLLAKLPRSVSGLDYRLLVVYRQVSLFPGTQFDK